MLLRSFIALTLALVPYAPDADRSIAEGFSWSDALSPRGNQAQNALGLIGATIAYGLIPNFLGYPVVLLALVLGGWGYVFFRRRTTVYLPLLTGLAVVATVLISPFIGWFADGGSETLALWSGDIGLGVAGWMKQVFGSVGSFILLVLLKPGGEGAELSL